MLDLNVEMVSSDDLPSYCNIDDRSSTMMRGDEEEMKILEEDDDEEGGDREVSAGTSDSSSVVNADDSPPSAGDVNSSIPLIFGILKKEDPGPGIVTRQLFPTAWGAGEGSQLSFGKPSCESRPQWLNLAFGGGKAAGTEEAAELRVLQQKQQVKKSRRGPRSRSSQYRGVTFYRRTGRWESHIWDCGKQVYLGGFDTAYAAARAYDRAAIKFRGVDADINFTIGDYDEDMKQQMWNLGKEDFVHVLRRESTGASRGNSRFRGVTALRKCGRWEAQIGQFIGKKTAIQFNGTNAVTNLERPHGGGTTLDVSTEDRVGGHNLDLNLGISSTPSSGGILKKAISGSHVRLCYSSTEMPPKQQEAQPLGYGSYAAPNHPPPIWSPIYNFPLPNSEGKGIMDMSVATSCSLNRGWQVQISNGSTSRTPLPMARVFPTAASSGFSSSSSSSSSTTNTPRLIHPNPTSPPLIKP